jgi:hypothetical protein
MRSEAFRLAKKVQSRPETGDRIEWNTRADHSGSNSIKVNRVGFVACPCSAGLRDEGFGRGTRGSANGANEDADHSESYSIKVIRVDFEVCLRAAVLRNGGLAGAPAAVRIGPMAVRIIANQTQSK